MNLTDPSVLDILRRSMVARIATMSRTGRPHVNPLYFLVIDGHIHLGTATATLAAYNVGANPQVQVLFEDERHPTDRRVLRISGEAVVRTDPDLMKRYRRGVARKYVMTPAGLWNMLVHPRQWVPMYRYTSAAEGCVIDVTPTSFEIIEDLSRLTRPTAVR